MKKYIIIIAVFFIISCGLRNNEYLTIESEVVIENEINCIQKLPFNIEYFKNKIYFKDDGKVKRIELNASKLDVLHFNNIDSSYLQYYDKYSKELLDILNDDNQIKEEFINNRYEVSNVISKENSLFSFGYLNYPEFKINNFTSYKYVPVLFNFRENGNVKKIIRLKHNSKNNNTDSGAVGFTPQYRMVLDKEEKTFVISGIYYDSMKVYKIPICKIAYNGDSMIGGDKLCDIPHPDDIAFEDYKIKKNLFIDRNAKWAYMAHLFENNGKLYFNNAEKVFEVPSGDVYFELSDSTVGDSLKRIKYFLFDNNDNTIAYYIENVFESHGCVSCGNFYLIKYNLKKGEVIDRIQLLEKTSGLSQDDKYVYFLSENDEGIYVNKVKK